MLGLSRVDAEDDIVGDWSPIVTSSFALTAERGDMWVAGDRFAFVVGQPLRAEQGRARVALPAASQAEPAQRSERVEVAPQGRELRFEAAYTRPVGPGMDLTALAFVRREPGHVASADDDLGIGFRFDWQW